MKRILLITLMILGFVTQGWATTYYVDKRCANNGNGTALNCAESPGGAGAWNEIWYVLERSNIPNGTHTVEIVQGSGAYDLSDLVDSDDGYFRPQQQVTSVVTYNFNGNELRSCWNVNDSTYYKWTASPSRSGQYYLTALDDTAPELSWASGTDISDIEMCVIGGVWNDDTMNISNTTSYKKHNWDWGDFDTLGFNTLYVKLESLTDPTLSGYKIFISRADDKTLVLLSGNGTDTGFGTFIFNDAVFSGGGTEAVSINSVSNKFNRCTFRWGGTTGINLEHDSADGNIFSYCRFIDFTHRAIQLDADAENNAVYHSFFSGAHLGIRFADNDTYTFTAVNNVFYNMYAGCVQQDVASPTFTESHNIYYIDPDSEHTGKAIAFTTSTRQWTTTASTSFPALAATTNTTGTDPLVFSNGKLQKSSDGIDNGAWIETINEEGQADSRGKYVHRLPNIGDDQEAGTPKRPTTIRIGGGGIN